MPINAKFTGGFCNDESSSTCKIKCDVGYDLVGSDQFVCKENGDWKEIGGSNITNPECISSLLTSSYSTNNK